MPDNDDTARRPGVRDHTPAPAVPQLRGVGTSALLAAVAYVGVLLLLLTLGLLLTTAFGMTSLLLVLSFTASWLAALITLGAMTNGHGPTIEASARPQPGQAATATTYLASPAARLLRRASDVHVAVLRFVRVNPGLRRLPLLGAFLNVGGAVGLLVVVVVLWPAPGAEEIDRNDLGLLLWGTGLATAAYLVHRVDRRCRQARAQMRSGPAALRWALSRYRLIAAWQALTLVTLSAGILLPSADRVLREGLPTGLTETPGVFTFLQTAFLVAATPFGVRAAWRALRETPTGRSPLQSALDHDPDLVRFVLEETRVWRERQANQWVRYTAHDVVVYGDGLPRYVFDDLDRQAARLLTAELHRRARPAVPAPERPRPAAQTWPGQGGQIPAADTGTPVARITGNGYRYALPKGWGDGTAVTGLPGRLTGGVDKLLAGPERDGARSLLWVQVSPLPAGMPDEEALHGHEQMLSSWGPDPELVEVAGMPALLHHNPDLGWAGGGLHERTAHTVSIPRRGTMYEFCFAAAPGRYDQDSPAAAVVLGSWAWTD